MNSLIEIKNYVDSWTYYLYGRARSSIQYYCVTGRFDVSQIIPNVYLGNIHSAYHKDQLKNLGITHILTIATGIVPAYPKDFEYCTVELCDTITANIQKYFDSCNQFIDQAITHQGKVFAHCICGVSRSATIVAAYLMYKMGYTAQEAITYLQEHRSCVNPNRYFREQLNIYEHRLNLENLGSPQLPS